MEDTKFVLKFKSLNQNYQEIWYLFNELKKIVTVYFFFR